jgi:hypothetical protein
LAELRGLRTSLAASLPLLILASCSSGPQREPLYPVKGQLFYEDRPAAGAVVWFHPLETMEEISPDTPATEPRPLGVVQEDGSFEVQTHGIKDGAPAGRYRLSVMWKRVKAKGGSDDEENLLPLRFLDPRLAGLPVVEVHAGPNVLPPFKLAKE